MAGSAYSCQVWSIGGDSSLETCSFLLWEKEEIGWRRRDAQGGSSSVQQFQSDISSWIVSLVSVPNQSENLVNIRGGFYFCGRSTAAFNQQWTPALIVDNFRSVLKLYICCSIDAFIVNRMYCTSFHAFILGTWSSFLIILHHLFLHFFFCICCTCTKEHFSTGWPGSGIFCCCLVLQQSGIRFLENNKITLFFFQLQMDRYSLNTLCPNLGPGASLVYSLKCLWPNSCDMYTHL